MKIYAGICNVPQRQELALALKEQLEGFGIETEIYVDEELQGYNYNYRRTLVSTLEKCQKGDKAIILTDDQILSEDFQEVLNELTDEYFLISLAKIKKKDKRMLRSKKEREDKFAKIGRTNVKRAMRFDDTGIIVLKPQAILHLVNSIKVSERNFLEALTDKMRSVRNASSEINYPLVKHNHSIPSTSGKEPKVTEDFIKE